MKSIRRFVIIAGSGSYPREIIEGAHAAGVPCVDVIAIRGSTDRATWKAADHVYWITLGEIAEGIRWMGSQGYDGAILAGQVNPLSLFHGGFDREVQSWLDELPVKTAHTIFSKLIDKFAEWGTTTLPASLYMDRCMPGAGLLTNRPLTDQEQSDLRHAAQVAHDVGVHDVGQTVMVKKGMVLAVEAFEGTNAAIRRGGKLGGRGAVVFKAARVGHDMRFDIPVMGVKTLKMLHKADATAIGFQAHRQIILDKEEVIAYANRHNIAIIGVESGLPAAPLRLV